ncbi:MAG: indole-3-glycerol phosphate synthase TrpC [Gemmatales bacterium]|nr:indole-3-glycerol phosphate synthase TrpC [Gemmatales bacterium]MDW8387736.1 indole-3-glycerol phosphate synthase TrpC [Gemmatales bacterium]
MSTILDRIVASKRSEIARLHQETSKADWLRRLEAAPPVRDFEQALRQPGVQVIAEIKRASPSAGAIRADADPVRTAQAYSAAGAACLSVLTDGPFFQGSLEDLQAVRNVVALPILRKDFILDRFQVWEARAAGADAVLLIAEILDDRDLRELLREIHAQGMTALVECYEAANLRRVVAAGARVIGINNRNLHTFEVRLEHTLELADQVPKDRVLVSESGIRSREDILRLEAVGVKAVLVGETLMRSADPGATLRRLRGL